MGFLLLGPDLLDLLLSAHGSDKISQLTDEELYEEALAFGNISEMKNSFHLHFLFQFSLVMKQQQLS